MTAILHGAAGAPNGDLPRHWIMQWARFTAHALRRLTQWRQRTRDRARLAELDDRMLADIGITRAQAEFLINKPFWRE